MSRVRGWRSALPACPKCERGFENAISMQQHLFDAHHVTLYEAARAFDTIKPVEASAFEDALVKIANSASHEEAIQIANAALLGERS